MSSSARRDHILKKAAGACLLVLAALTVAACPGKHNTITGPSTLTVSSVSPNTAGQNTPTDVRINGTGFEAGATATIGSAATNVTVVNATTITATAPAHAVGSVDVVVTNPGGVSARLSGGFTYLAPPVLTVANVSPLQGLGGDVFQVAGTKFQTGARVAVDGQPALSSIVVASTAISIVAPAHAAGKVDVTVTNPDGESATKVGAFTYQQVTLSVSSSSVAAGGALSVSWVAPNGRPSADWIALYKAGAAPETYVDGWWEYTQGKATGTLSLTAPSVPGSYEFRYLVDDGFVVAVQSGIIVVTVPATADAPPTGAALSRALRWR